MILGETFSSDEPPPRLSPSPSDTSRPGGLQRTLGLWTPLGPQNVERLSKIYTNRGHPRRRNVALPGRSVDDRYLPT